MELRRAARGAKLPSMKSAVWLVFPCGILLAAGRLAVAEPAPAPAEPQVDALEKKIDEQSTKIDALTQHILKLEQQLGETKTLAAAPAESAVPAMSPSTTPSPSASAAPTHVVARGETLTSIAKQYHVTVEELQKLNHIEDDRKLQIGQTLVVPTTGTSASPAVAPKKTDE